MPFPSPMQPSYPSSLQIQACRYAEDINILLEQFEALQQRMAALAAESGDSISMALSARRPEQAAEPERQLAWHIESALEQALANDEFHLLYQPQVSLNGSRLTGVEALLRWHTPLADSLSPEVFIPVAESSGLIVDIGHWVLHAACRQLHEWQQAGLDGLRMAVNVSPLQLRHHDFADRVLEALEAYALSGNALELEITESDLVSHPDATIDMLQQLRQRGISIAIDDFGTGHSSLARLHKLPVDRLKVDRSFTCDLECNREAQAISACIIALARDLNLEVIAEGVENTRQLQHLLEQGCHAIQGFLFARPMPADALLSWQQDCTDHLMHHWS